MKRRLDEEHGAREIKLSFLSDEYSSLFSMSDSLKSVNDLLLMVPKNERDLLNRLHDALLIDEKVRRVVFSINKLKKYGFRFNKKDGKLIVGRPGFNEFAFSNEFVANEAQLRAKGYISSKPVYLADYGKQIDPYILVDFIEWLLLQNIGYIEEIPEIEFFASVKRNDRPEHLYLVDGAIHVFMGKIATSRFGSLETWGLGPCIGLAMADSGKKVGLLAHITAANSEDQIIKSVQGLLNKIGTKINRTKFILAGGQNLSEDGILEEANNLRDMLMSMGASLVSDFSGQATNNLRLDTNRMIVTLRTESTTNDKTFSLI